MEQLKASALMLQAEKALPQPVYPYFIKYCPTMDLVAIVTQEEYVDIYRLSGQRAFALKPKDETVKVTGLCWKFNGRFLAVAWDDGTVDIVSSETGKVVQHTAITGKGFEYDQAVPPITCLGFAVNFSDVDIVKGRTETSGQPTNVNLNDSLPVYTDGWDKKKNGVSLDDFLERHLNVKALDIKPDLPDQIALLDVETLLPKLPIISLPPMVMGLHLPPGDSTPEVFTTQPSIDAVFHSPHSKDHNAVDTLVVCQKDGVITPMLYDSLQLGKFDLSRQWGLEICKPILHTFHPYTCSHNILLEVSDKAKNIHQTALAPLSFGFVSTAGLNAHVVATKTAQLQNLLRYIRQCLRCISVHWAQAQDLPSRFMRNINQTLEDNNEGTLIQNLYHVAVTGNCPPSIKEWLVDILTESGHKRWDHAVVQGYTKIIELTHENLLPALDRCSIVASRLRGLAKYNESDAIFNVPSRAFTEIMENTRCQRLIAHHLLTYAADEKRGFIGFSKWLRREIDIQAADPESASAEETAEQDIGASYTDILRYVSEGMTNSKLIPFLKPPVRPTDSPTYEDVRKALSFHSEGALYNDAVVSLWAQFLDLEAQSNRIFIQITSFQLTSTTMNYGLILEEDEIPDAQDSRMVYENLKDSNQMTTYIALVPRSSPHQLRLHRLIHAPLFNSASSLHSASAVTFTFPTESSIQDVKFADDVFLLLILHSNEASYLIRITYRATLPQGPPYASRTVASLPNGKANDSSARPVVDLQELNSLTPYVRHTFTKEEGFTPISLDVNGRKDRRVLVVLGKDSKRYRVYDLDFEGVEYGEGETTVDVEMG